MIKLQIKTEFNIENQGQIFYICMLVLIQLIVVFF